MDTNDQMDLVPRWFEMLKELRNGTISYIQLIKREQIRPPVRPVCRRLGVAKLSDIVSEDILYRAIVQVAESQGKSPTRGGENGGIDPIMGDAEALMNHGNPDLLGPGPSGSSGQAGLIGNKYFDPSKGVSFDGLTSRGIDRDRVIFNSTDIDEDYDPMAGYEPHGLSKIMSSGMLVSPLHSARSAGDD
jgi:hypothetical protein